MGRRLGRSARACRPQRSAHPAHRAARGSELRLGRLGTPAGRPMAWRAATSPRASPVVTRGLTLVGLALLVALVGHPWLHPRLMWEDVADAPNHLLRIYAITHSMQQGSLYPRWLPDLYLGYGYPLLNFYAPATYFVGAALHAIGLSVYASLQWTGMAALALGAAGAFTLARALGGGSRAAGAIAVVAYVCAPYSFITNLLVRAAIPEALALGLFPWLLYATLRVVTRPSRGALAALTIGIALLVLTHNVSALITLPIVITFAAVAIAS